MIKGLLLILLPISGFAQTPGEVKKKAKPSRPAWLAVAVGKQYAVFRDFATSPLFYAGTPSSLGLFHLEVDAHRESKVQFSYSFGQFRSTFDKSEAVSQVNTLMLNYTELFELPGVSSPKFNLKVGGQLRANANLRENEAFGNNSDGFEVITTLFGSVKGSLNLNREPNKQKRKLALGLNLGLINTSYRNGFIYTSQSPLLNREGSRDAYELRVFAGYRISTSLDYRVGFKNGNGLQLSYLWDAYSTGTRYDKLEMASHLLQISLLFNLKKPS